jgi:hypothetical protein
MDGWNADTIYLGDVLGGHRVGIDKSILQYK